MKKRVWFPLLFTLIALTYCGREYLSNPAKETSEVMFNFSASVPDAANQTRAVNITRYIVDIYKTADLSTIVKRVEQASGTIVVELENNTNYTCLFWADEVAIGDNTNGIFNALDLKNVTLNTGKTMTDAFFARLDITNTATTFNVTLNRATAKVNMVATQAVTANTDLKVTYNEYKSFNTYTSDIAGATVATSKTFNSATTEGTLGTFLTFASVAGILTDFTTLYNSAVTNEIKNIPLKANYVTNIRGNYAAGAQDFTIIITVNDIWTSTMDGVDINVGTPASPVWIRVADRNALKGGTDGAVANATDYGYYYTWSNATNDPSNADKSYRACFDFAEGNGAWRLPTKDEWIAISGNSGTSHTTNANRKLKWDATNWKLYDERIGQEANFVYFPLGGFATTSGSNPNSLSNTTVYGTYWTSVQAWRLSVVNDGSSDVGNYNASAGYNVRCVRSI